MLATVVLERKSPEVWLTFPPVQFHARGPGWRIPPARPLNAARDILDALFHEIQKVRASGLLGRGTEQREGRRARERPPLQCARGAATHRRAACALRRRAEPSATCAGGDLPRSSPSLERAHKSHRRARSRADRTAPLRRVVLRGRSLESRAGQGVSAHGARPWIRRWLPRFAVEDRRA